MKQLFNEMDTTNESVPPLVMVKVLHMTIPRFAERGEQGGFQQQVKHQEIYCDQTRAYTNTLGCSGPPPR